LPILEVKLVRHRLLSSVKAVIIEHNVNAFIRKRLTKFERVCAPLVYHYCQSRLSLLQALLRRAYQQFVNETETALQVINWFERVVSVAVSTHFNHHAPGHILSRLRSQLEVAIAIKESQMLDQRRQAKLW